MRAQNGGHTAARAVKAVILESMATELSPEDEELTGKIHHNKAMVLTLSSALQPVPSCPALVRPSRMLQAVS